MWKIPGYALGFSKTTEKYEIQIVFWLGPIFRSTRLYSDLSFSKISPEIGEKVFFVKSFRNDIFFKVFEVFPNEN